MKYKLIFVGVVATVVVILLSASPVSADEITTTYEVELTGYDHSESTGQFSIDPFLPNVWETGIITQRTNSGGWNFPKYHLKAGAQSINEITATIYYDIQQEELGGYPCGQDFYLQLRWENDSVQWRANTHIDWYVDDALICSDCPQSGETYLWQRDCNVDPDFDHELRIELYSGDESTYYSNIELIRLWLYQDASSGQPDVSWATAYNIVAPVESYCPDGTEALTNTVTLDASYDTWTESLTTTYDRLAVRYIITTTDDINADLSTNGVDATIYEADVTGTYTYTHPLGGVPGPHANLSFYNRDASNDTISLLSACVISSPSTCIGGVEALTSPVTLGGFDSWASGPVSTTWDRVKATVYLAGRYPAGLATLEHQDYSFWLSSDNPVDIVTFTIPIDLDDGGISVTGDSVEAEILNTGSSFDLTSVCLQNSPPISAPLSCNLTNHDFITDTHGWDVGFGEKTWLDETSGAALVTPDDNFATIDQSVVDRSLEGYYQFSARVRGVTETITVTLMADPFDQQKKFTVGTSYETVSADILFDNPERIYVETQGGAMAVDWVCLEQASPDDDWRFEIGECVFPEFDDHPGLSLDSLPDWVLWIAGKVGDLIVWAVCELERIILMGLNAIMDIYDAIGFPEFPDDLSLGSLILWLRETYRAFGNWLGESLQNIVFSGQTLGSWLRSQLLTLAEWFWEDIILELIFWIMDQAEAAGIIGEDTIDRLRLLWRDAVIFIDALETELSYQFDDLQALATETGNVFWVLLTGWQSSLSGDAELDMGEDLGGLAAYLWRGVQFVDEVVTITPLSALNIVALGVIAWGLGAWTIQKFLSMAERLA